MSNKTSTSVSSPKSVDEEKNVLPLASPIKWGEGEDQEIISKLEFGELRAGDIEDMSLPFSIGDFLRMASRVTGVPYQALLKLKAPDTLLVTTVMDRFFAGGQETGSS